MSSYIDGFGMGILFCIIFVIVIRYLQKREKKNHRWGEPWYW